MSFDDNAARIWTNLYQMQLSPTILALVNATMCL
jgi:hypothetical protein